MKETLNIFSTEIQESHISNIYTKNYHALPTDYLELQRDWLHRAYSQFQDLDKYFILISLVNKTMSAYSDYMLSYTWDEYYKPKEVELKKFSIVDIAKELDISKETARRKILELEKEKGQERRRVRKEEGGEMCERLKVKNKKKEDRGKYCLGAKGEGKTKDGPEKARKSIYRKQKGRE